jgi:hypothetical protein
VRPIMASRLMFRSLNSWEYCAKPTRSNQRSSSALMSISWRPSFHLFSALRVQSRMRNTVWPLAAILPGFARELNQGLPRGQVKRFAAGRRVRKIPQEASPAAAMARANVGIKETSNRQANRKIDAVQRGSRELPGPRAQGSARDRHGVLVCDHPVAATLRFGKRLWHMAGPGKASRRVRLGRASGHCAIRRPLAQCARSRPHLSIVNRQHSRRRLRASNSAGRPMAMSVGFHRRGAASEGSGAG